jgi:hypothetical protein
MKGLKQGLISLGLTIALLEASVITAMAQTNITPTPRQNGTGGWINYPAGSQIYRNGAIVLPDSRTVYPTNTVRNGDGTTSFYYADGTKITTQGNAINPSGSYLIPGSNGNLHNNSLSAPPNYSDPLFHIR